MYDEGPHIVLRRDGVCIVAKTPDGDMPQIEYWGRDFALDTAGARRNAGSAATLTWSPSLHMEVVKPDTR